MTATPLSALSPQHTLHVLAKCGHDHYTIVGVYGTAERAEDARVAVVGAERLDTRAYLRGNDDSYRIDTYVLNETLLQFQVSKRRDGAVVETMVFVGDKYGEAHHERQFHGRAKTLEQAHAEADKAIGAEDTACLTS